MSKDFGYKLLTFLFSFGAYVPLAIGGWGHPEELNIATYSIWTLLTLMLTYAARKQEFSGWYLTTGFFFGNLSMVGLGLARGGYTFNLGPSETIALYGLTLLVMYATVQWYRGHAEEGPKQLYIGAVITDVLSFWPQIKQYLLPDHPVATPWILAGFSMFLIGVLLNLVLVEEFLSKLFTRRSAYTVKFGKPKNILKIFEESFFSIENAIILPVTIYLMAR